MEKQPTALAKAIRELDKLESDYESIKSEGAANSAIAIRRAKNTIHAILPYEREQRVSEKRSEYISHGTLPEKADELANKWFDATYTQE